MRLKYSSLVVASSLAALAFSACDCAPPIAVVSEDSGVDAGAEEADAGAEVDAGEPDAGFLPDAGPLTCHTCHGTTLSDAPPRDTLGRVERGLATVGAHQSHVGPSTWHREVRCDDCHVVPATIDAPGHIDPSPAELTFSRVANASGVSARYDGGTCGAYCHGPTLEGGALTQPEWTRSDVAQTYCGDCHGVPPPAPHPQISVTDCSRCHPDARPGLGFKEPERHIDGVLDLNVTCVSCHGSGTNPAPPSDTLGRTSTSLRSVGAHRSHLGPSTWHMEFGCGDCHQVPQRYDDPGHIDSPLPAELTWSNHATAKGATPAFNGVTCSGVYCHGTTIAGGDNKTPTWTALGTGEAACGTCHSLPPTSMPHTPSMPLTQCGVCHDAVIDTNARWVRPELHINGLVEVSGGACGSCHELPPKTGAHMKHAGLAMGVYGGLDTAANLTNPTGYAFGCAYCHPSDPAKHAKGGLAEVELYNANAPLGSLKRLSPTAVYTPGTQTFTDAKGRAYTLGTCANVYCHSGPSYATPDVVPAAGTDFAFTGYPLAFPSYALNLGRSYQTANWGGAALPCGGCHGFPIRTQAPGVQAMAGQSHSWLDASGNESGHGWNHGFSPVPCTTCHTQTVTAQNATSRAASGSSIYSPVPIAGFAFHVNGKPDVVFDTARTQPYLTPKSLAGASYSQATQTCSNVACHLDQTAVKHGTPFRSDTVTPECNVCHQY